MLFSPNFTQIGYLEKAHGVEGWIKYNLYEPEKSILQEMDFLFLEIHHQKVPFQLEKLNEQGGLLKLMGYKDRETLNPLLGSGIYQIADEKRIEPNQDLIGLKVISEDGQDVGRVTGINSIPGNPLIEIEDGKHLIPFNPELVIAYDEEKKELKYQIPSGLLEL